MGSYSVMRICLLGCLLALLAVLGLFVVHAQRREHHQPAADWLQSQSVQVQLGVWNKNGPTRAYDAVFIVTGPDGNQYKSERHNKTGDDWVYTLFPQDFDKYPENTTRSATYSWKCVVAGKTISSGQFQWSNSRAATP